MRFLSLLLIASLTTTATAAATADETIRAAQPIDAEASFAAGTWNVADGGNSYLGKTTRPDIVQVCNKGPGRVSVRFTNDWGWSFSIALPPGGTLTQFRNAGWHVEVIDGGRDGLGANGTYVVN